MHRLWNVARHATGYPLLPLALLRFSFSFLLGAAFWGFLLGGHGDLLLALSVLKAALAYAKALCK